MQFQKLLLLLGLMTLTGFPKSLLGQGFEGYYRYPTVHGDHLVFTAEGDLWKVPLAGGMAARLTSHLDEETHPHISPDGKTIAFRAAYEGSMDLYTMPIDGGLPERWTFGSELPLLSGWTPDGKLLYATRYYSTLPDYQLVQLDLATKRRSRVPLYQASEGCYSADGKTVFFVRPADHRNVTKRYLGGTARKIWKYSEGAEEAVRLSDDYAGESHHPMWWQGRVYFITDRDGIMNIWSMTESGEDLQQHTEHKDFDVRYATLSEGQIVYQRGADIWHLDLESGAYKLVPIRIVSDLDQRREKWETNPAQYLTSAHLHPEGKQVVLTARGRVFVAPVKSGRMVQLSRESGVRFRDATFMPDGKNIVVLSDQSGEFEFYQTPADGMTASQQLTNDGEVLRYQGVPSPDGKWIAYTDLQENAWLLNVETKAQRKISTNQEGVGGLSWSPDSKWLAFVQTAHNSFSQIFLHGLENKESTPITTDRMNDESPRWSPDGQFIYFLSDRNFQSLVGSPWGTRQPEAYFDHKYQLYHIPLQAETTSPFQPKHELSPAEDKDSEEDEKDKEKTVSVKVDFDGIQQRIYPVPVEPGNYRGLEVGKKAIYFLSRETGLGGKTHLMALKIDWDQPKAKSIAEGVGSFELSGKGKHLLIRKGRDHYVVEAGTQSISDWGKAKLNLSSWKFALDPLEDWKQLFTDAWRMERDYFYDPNMHGVDWDAMHAKYLPLVDRVTTREELSDLIGRFVGELSALHTSVRGGDTRDAMESIGTAALGARLRGTDDGYLVEKIYQADPDFPEELSPLQAPGVNISEGDLITHIDGIDVGSVNHLNALLRNKGGAWVRVGYRTSGGQEQEAMVKPTRNEYSLRYHDWEYSRRQEVDRLGEGKIGYVHLQAMGSNDLARWYREFYPVHDRQGLIIDVRGNRGGNIESLILEKLLRPTWFYWKGRSGEPYGNMPYAFNGHMVVLMDARTASDGEAFAEGFKRLGMGKLIGMRTWGGEIWLSSANRLSDNGIARAPMFGVYSPEGEWIVENHGVEPDIEVDNLPHQTFEGKDAQLEAAIEHLEQLIEQDPRLTPPVPPYPDKSVPGNRRE